MALEAFLDSNSQSPMPSLLPLNGCGGILEALTSPSSLNNEEDLNSILNMAQLKSNFGSDIAHLRNSSTSGAAVGLDAAIAIPTGAQLRSPANTTVEPFISLPPYRTQFPSDNPVNVLHGEDTVSHLCEAREKENKKQHWENAVGSTDTYKTKVQPRQDSHPGRKRQEMSTLSTSMKKSRIHVNQENIQREIIQKLLIKELQDCNPQLKEMIEQYGQQARLRGLHLQIPKQLVKTQSRSLLLDQGTRQEILTPLLDGGICSRRLKQYLFHLRNKKNDNSIYYWKTLVSEYFAPDSKKMWCFSRYENIELHTAGVFCPQSMESWCCQICGSKSGKGLEATFAIFPRLFKIKYESGMLDEILFLDSPQTCKVACGVMLEYRKAIQESVYETFRVVHRGKLRIVFRPDLKILSWEFCIENHDALLLRTLFTPQVNQLVQAAEIYQDIQNSESSQAVSQDLRKVCNMFVSAGTQILRSMELPLVNDLGYPKRFIRCLQIGEVVDDMSDLMTISYSTKLGPIECLNSFSQANQTDNQKKWKEETELFFSAQNRATLIEQPCAQFHANGCWGSDSGVISGPGYSGMALVNSNDRLPRPNSSIASSRKNWLPASSIKGHPNQAMASGQSFSSSLHNEATQQSDETCGSTKEVHYGESFNGACIFSQTGDISGVDEKSTGKEEPYSQEGLLDDYLVSAPGFPKIQDCSW